jgi:hypothetical protein
MADLTRTISLRSGRPVLVYVKPHRGATIQRLLGIAARGVKAFDWYDDESGRSGMNGQSDKIDRNLRNQGKAARLLGAAEDVLYDAMRVPERSEVAFLSANRVNGSAAHFQDAKWVWTALQHDGVVVDVIDEGLIERGDLSGRKVLYLVGVGLRQKAFETVREWVRKGGTLWTDICGMSSNEFGQAIVGVEELTGQKTHAPALWGTDPGYKATKLEEFGGTEKGKPYEAPANAVIELKPAVGDGQAKAAIGREKLNAEGAEILATFADGAPAVIGRHVGQGRVFVVGTYAGLAYSEKVRREDFDMSADFFATARRLVSFAAAQAVTARPAIASVPTVETALVRNGPDAALCLMNWTYRATTNGAAHVPAQSLRVALPAIAGAAQVISSAGRAVSIQADGKGSTLLIDRLDEGDTIVLRGTRWQ